MLLPLSVDGRPEALRLEPFGGVPLRVQQRRHGLNEGRWSADVNERALLRTPRDARQQVTVDAPRVSRPARRRLPGKSFDDLQVGVLSGHPLELIAIEDLLHGA